MITPVKKVYPSYPRNEAIRVITRVLSDQVNIDQALEEVAGQLSGPDRAWVTEMASGVLRWKTRLDQVIDAQALKKKPTGWVRKALLMGAYQLLVQTRVIPAQIVSETVEWIKKKEGEAPSQFANACLRRISEQVENWKTVKRPGDKTSFSDSAIWAGLPEWWYKKISKERGHPWALDFGVSTLERPLLWIRKKGEAKPVSLSEDEKPEGVIPEWPGFKEGEFFVQDLSSQILVQDVSDELKKLYGANPLVLDRCAAPGGKAAGLNWNGIRVIATDYNPKRFDLLESTVSRVAPEVKIMSKSEALSDTSVDAIWIDAPCSGSGIIRRHPDVKWLRTEKDLKALIETQKKLVKEEWARLKSGGALIYTVCSVFEDEGEGLLKFLKLAPHVKRQWLLAPHLDPSTDGFYGALLIKP